MKMFTVFASALALVGVAYAADPSSTNPQSKENQVFEAQGNNNVAKYIWQGLKAIAKGFAENTDGTLTISDSYITSTMGDSQQIKVGLETRIYGIKEQDERKESCGYYSEPYVECKDWHPGVLIIPMEVHVVANVNDPSKIDLSDFKAGAVRVLLKKYSLTFQGLSYFYKKNEIGLGSYDGFEIVNATFNDVTDLSGNGKIELVYKLTAGIGMSGMYSNPTRKAVKEQQDANTVPVYDAGLKMGGKSPGFYFSSGASIGVRFSKQVLIDLFGGYTTVGDKRDGEYRASVDEYRDDVNFDAKLTDLFGGAGVRYEPSKYFNARVSYQHDRYRSSAGYYDLDGGARGSQSESANVVSGMIELRW